MPTYDTRFIENKSIKQILEQIPGYIKELGDKWGPLDRISVIIMQNDRGGEFKGKYNAQIACVETVIGTAATAKDDGDRPIDDTATNDGASEVTHRLTRIGVEPGEADVYKAKCGYKSEDKKQFILEGEVTCADCNT